VLEVPLVAAVVVNGAGLPAKVLIDKFDGPVKVR
jgi:hypothetical protein